MGIAKVGRCQSLALLWFALVPCRLRDWGVPTRPSKKKLREHESLSPLWRPRSTYARSPGTMELPRVQGRVRWSLRTVGGGVDSLAQQMEPKAYQSITHQKKSKKSDFGPVGHYRPHRASWGTGGLHGPWGVTGRPWGRRLGVHTAPGGTPWGRHSKFHGGPRGPMRPR